MSELIQKERGAHADNYYPRIDGHERVVGSAKYAGDWKVPDMLYGRIVKSKVPHGIVKSIDYESASKIPGVSAIITCIDDKTIWSAGEREHPRRVFADRVRYIGDCVAAVAAETRDAAREASDALAIEYEELPAVFTVEESRREGAPKVWADGNVIGPLTYGFGDPKSSFERATLLIEADYSTSRVHNAPLEPAVSLAWWEGEKLTVVAATQGIFNCRDGLAQDLGIPVENVRVITLYKGGGFGNKNNSMNYDIIAALLARKTGKPVMVEYSRLDDFLGVHGRWSSIQHLRAAVDVAKARLLAMDLMAYCDIGAYTRAIKASTLIGGPDGYYDAEAWSAEVYGVYTNTPTTANMRAPTGPQANFAAESLMDEAANRLGVNPLEFRLRNLVSDHHRERRFTSNGLRECVESGAKAIGWKERWHLPPKSLTQDSDQKLSGLGMAIASYHSGLGLGEAVVKMTKEGILEVYTGVVDIGTGAKSTMAIIAAKAIGIPLEYVKVIWGDTGTCPYSVGESGSRTTTHTGYAVRDAAVKLREKILQLATARLSGRPGDLTIEGNRVANRAGMSIELADLVHDSGLDSVSETARTEPRLPENVQRSAFAAHFVEVEVDIETGAFSLKRYVAAHESGEIVNRLTAESQVQGAIVMGLGMAMSERVLIDTETGYMQNPSFLTYRLPNISAIPRIEVIFAQTTDPFGPKSIGEIGIVPVAAALGNAIFNATGKRLRKLPFMPEALLGELDSPLSMQKPQNA